MDEYLDKLNPQQRDAVEYLDGPELVIAGAGSGKTRVLTHKIIHLLNNGYEPWRILALTFTNKAAKEMRERIMQLVGPQTASRIWLGTFHSIFAWLLRQHADRIGYKPSFTIYDTADSKSLVKSIIKDMDLDDKIYKPSVVLSAISTAKNALISPEKYTSLKDLMEADKQARRPMIYAIYRVYRDRCFSSSAMDFDDLLYYMNVLLRDNPDILHHYQEFFRFVLVDEYQDTNFAQHVIVSQICSASQKLCVVGDDAQSIYSFRGANLSNILNLKHGYPSLRIFKLEQNYRSTQNIINAANSLIEKNTMQIKKHVFSKKEPGDRIEVVKSYSDFEEGYLVANRISQLKMRTSDSYEDFAILYRTNAQSRVLEESLRKRNIPYRIYGGLSFYQRKEVKDAIAYFRLSVNPSDDEALKRVINYPTRGIGETTLNKLLRAAIEQNVSVWSILSSIENQDLNMNAGAKRKLIEFRSLIQSFIDANNNGQNAEEVARLIISRTQLLTILLTDKTPENLSKQENLNELLSGVREFIDTRTEEGRTDLSMSEFLGEVSLATDQDTDDTDGQAAERVTLMTVHAAKGLEFNNVFIVGVEEDLFPSAMSNSSAEEIEEERRLLYVALTRAKNFCMMSYASSRYRNGMTCMPSPSRFLRDIDPRYLRLTDGAMTEPTRSFASFRESYHSPAAFGHKSQPTATKPGARTSGLTQQRPVASAARPASSAPDGMHGPDELSGGMIIEHSRFGLGKIADIDTSHSDARITVDFDTCGRRVLLLKFARFKIIKN